MTPILEAQNVAKRYPHQAGWRRRTAGWIHAVDGVSMAIHPGETVGLVGESGCGKSTLARLLVGLESPTSGEVLYRGQPLHTLAPEARRAFHREIQLIFQSSVGSLNPRLIVRELVAEPLRIHRLAAGRALADRVAQLLEEVGLEVGLSHRYPSELSGGQRQRVAIARALAVRPALIICDEAVASLDVSIQRQILALLARLQTTHGMAYGFISHHLGVVGTIAQRVLVMYLGRVVEAGDNPALFREPLHPYTQALVASVARSPREAPPPVLGEPPSALQIPSGCRFHPRCPIAEPRCRLEDPPLIPRRHPRPTACLFA